MPGPLDLVMAAALRLLGCRLLVVVHEADVHPGDGYPMQMAFQRALCRFAGGLVSLSSHVGAQLKQQGIISTKRPLIFMAHPPFALRSAALSTLSRSAPSVVFWPAPALQRA